MSDHALAPVTDLDARRRRPSEGLLAGVSLFDGLAPDALADLAAAFERVQLAPGDVLWRQATPSDGLYVLVEGEVQVCRRLPGERELELARLGAGTVLGELPLLGGGARTATVRALGRCSLLFLRREEFEARTMSSQAGALELRRRIVALACERLRLRLATFSGKGDGARPLQPEPEPAAVAPPPSYVSRLALFRHLEPGLVAELLDRSAVLEVRRGRVVQGEAEGPRACFVTLKGAVEDVPGPGEPRVGFAGPGRAFGYLGLLDGRPAPVSSVARERSLVLAIGRDHFSELLRSPGTRSRAFASAIEADLITSLDLAERARSRQAAGAPG